MRLFVALVPPEDARADLEEHVAPRRESGPGLRWTLPEQWHVTLAFAGEVPAARLEDVLDRVAEAAARRRPFGATLVGAGAFPGPDRAKVLWTGVEPEDPTAASELDRLARGARAGLSVAGAAPEGGRFHPHLTVARSGRPLSATRWIRSLGAYRGAPWRAGSVDVVASHLGEGPRRRPRHEVLATVPLGRSTARDACPAGRGRG